MAFPVLIPSPLPHETPVQVMYRRELMRASTQIASLRHENHALKLALDEALSENSALRLERAGLESAVDVLEAAIDGRTEGSR